MFAYEKVDGLDREQLLAVIEPVLRAHQVRGVELIWRTDQRGRLLYITLEPDTEDQDGAVNLEVCTDVSRDLSAALDVVDVISAAYRLEVGSPGVERSLYSRADYERFLGRLTKFKLKEPLNGEWTVRGRLDAVADTALTVEADTGAVEIPFEKIASGNLVLDWDRLNRSPKARAKKKASGTSETDQGLNSEETQGHKVGE